MVVFVFSKKQNSQTAVETREIYKRNLRIHFDFIAL
jgi:hypothetical protein